MKVGFFEEKSGVRSITRVTFLGGVIWACVFVTIGTFFFKWSSGEIIAVFGGISAPFFALKLIQKPMEKSNDNNSKPE